MRKAKRLGCAFLLVASGSAGLVAQERLAPVTLTTIATFDEHGQDNGPTGPVVSDPSGALYGSVAWNDVTQGLVFKLTPPASAGGAWTNSVVQKFGGGANGSYPSGGLILDAQGNLYGVTPSGGAFNPSCRFGCGVVFQLQPPAVPGEPWSENVLYSFTGDSDGASPYGPLVLKNGALYGTATSGGIAGANCPAGTGCGVVFALAPPGQGGGAWTYHTLHSFTGGQDGGEPTGSLVSDRSGVLYGTTYVGGTSNAGTVYMLAPATAGGPWSETVLHSLNGGSDGTSPSALVGHNGMLYGAAYGGGDASCGGCGTVFQLTPPAQTGGVWSFAVIFAFAHSRHDGTNPTSLAFGLKGELFGAAQGGGGDPQLGALFMLTPPSTADAAWTEEVVYDFGGHGTARPGGLSVGSNGMLYGVTDGGWALYPARYLGPGTVFQLTQ